MCQCKTLKGLKCKNSSLSGSDYCRVHQKCSSIIFDKNDISKQTSKVSLKMKANEKSIQKAEVKIKSHEKPISKEVKIVETPKVTSNTKVKIKYPEKSISKNVENPKVTQTTTQCIKVGSLRKEAKDKTITLKKWMANPKNVYVGRSGRIFIGAGEDKEIFHYKGSKFANPYKVGTKEGEYSLEESIKLYKLHLKNKELIEKAKKELKGKNLGCFCDQKGLCHAKVLAEIVSK